MKNYLYVLGTEDGYIKIGITNDENINNRVRNLQVGNPKKINVLFFEERPAAEKAEKYLHKEFRKYRQTGEWFHGITLFQIRSKLMMFHDQI